MEEKVMTVEEIDQHLQKSQSTTRDIASTVQDICSTYKDVRPILVFAKNLLFFKPKWQKVIQSLLNVMDTNCNVQTENSNNNNSSEDNNG